MELITGTSTSGNTKLTGTCLHGLSCRGWAASVHPPQIFPWTSKLKLREELESESNQINTVKQTERYKIKGYILDNKTPLRSPLLSPTEIDTILPGIPTSFVMFSTFFAPITLFYLFTSSFALCFSSPFFSSTYVPRMPPPPCTYTQIAVKN